MSTQELRKCYICGEEVLWRNIGLGWHPIQYHDCKPVPLARLQRVERERDEALAEVARLRNDPKADARAVIEEWRAKAERAWSDAAQAQERLEQAGALLREAKERIGYDKDGVLRSVIHAFLAGQPAPVKVVVDDAMVERALTVYGDDAWKARPFMRAALVAALEGRI